MENQDQGQGWLRGAIIAGAVAAAIIYLVNRRGEPATPVEAVAGSAGAAATAAGSSEMGGRIGHIAQLLLANISDGALEQVKSALKDVLHRLETIVDEL